MTGQKSSQREDSPLRADAPPEEAEEASSPDLLARERRSQHSRATTRRSKSRIKRRKGRKIQPVSNGELMSLINKFQSMSEQTLTRIRHKQQ